MPLSLLLAIVLTLMSLTHCVCVPLSLLLAIVLTLMSLIYCLRSSPGDDIHRFAGSETESEAAALDKEFWVKRASEVHMSVCLCTCMTLCVLGSCLLIELGLMYFSLSLSLSLSLLLFLPPFLLFLSPCFYLPSPLLYLPLLLLFLLPSLSLTYTNSFPFGYNKVATTGVTRFVNSPLNWRSIDKSRDKQTKPHPPTRLCS